MVCRDAFTHKSRPVNPLILETEEEKALFARGKGGLPYTKYILENNEILSRAQGTASEATSGRARSCAAFL